jgi:hypothetical protein
MMSSESPDFGSEVSMQHQDRHAAFDQTLIGRAAAYRQTDSLAEG